MTTTMMTLQLGPKKLLHDFFFLPRVAFQLRLPPKALRDRRPDRPHGATGQDLVPEPEDEAEEAGAGREAGGAPRAAAAAQAADDDDDNGGGNP